MSDASISPQDRSDRGRFMLLPEDPAAAATAATADPRRPRIRRYRLARFGGDDASQRGGSDRRSAADFGYLRRSHD